MNFTACFPQGRKVKGGVQLVWHLHPMVSHVSQHAEVFFFVSK